MSSARRPSDGILRVAPAAPRLGLARACRAAVLRALETIEIGELTLRLPDGSVRRFGDASTGPSVAATIRSDDLFRRIALRGQVGLGESYVAGDWEADGDLAQLIALLVRNAEVAVRSGRYGWLVRLRELRPYLARANAPDQARAQIRYHYDLGNDLYALFLDESMTYSCAYFEHEGQSLEDAQQAKYRRLCEKLAIGPDDHVVEIGCGWGGFAVHAARERGARVTGVTISTKQYELARRRVREAGLEHRVEILEQDYRTLRGAYTKLVSIEMLEAVGERELGTFFATCDRLLAPNGLAALQVICVPDQRFARYRRNRDWIQEYIFPGSLIPSLHAISAAVTGSSSLLIQGVEDIGIHYATTLRQWRERFFAHLPDVRALGYDDRFVRTWEYYLASCEAVFSTRSLRDLQIVLTRPFNDTLPRYPSLRLTF